MKPIIRNLTLLTLLAISVSGAVASAGIHRESVGRPGIQQFIHRLQRLDLSSDQQQQLSQILHDTLPAMVDLRLSMRDVRRQLRGLTRQPTLDRKQLQTLAARQGELSEQLVIRRGTAIHSVFAMLTEVQRQRLGRHAHPA